MDRFYSFIIPLYNRPDEIDELLESLTHQTYSNFEVVIVEDGSKISGKDVVQSYEGRLGIQYHYKENGGQGFARNYGMERAKGDYFIILDSDVIVPEDYLAITNAHLNEHDLDAWGGPDAAHESFTAVQKAISYSMTSLFTTGGIRGKKKHVGTFHPRSFNMGLKKEVFKNTGGFQITRLGEDIIFSLKIIEQGYKTGLIPEAHVFHKRRTDLKRFFNQISFFGRSRINIAKFYPKELKLIHFFPAVFLIAFVSAIILAFFGFLVFSNSAYQNVFFLPIAAFAVYACLIFIDALVQTKSLKIAFLGVIASFIQLLAYGKGFIADYLKRIVLSKDHGVTEYPE